MPGTKFSGQPRTIGRIAALGTFFLIVVYAIVLILGLLSLKSPQDPIGDPYFTMMEILIVLLAPLMVISMVELHLVAPPESKVYSLTALTFMIIMAVITCSVHFVILTVSRQIVAAGLPGVSLFLSFTWPSVIYALDILAWDFFFALSVLFAAPLFQGGRLETALRYLLIASGVLSLVGLIGVPMADMNIRNIGIIGYVGVASIAFLFLGIFFRHIQPLPDPSRQRLGSQMAG